MNTEYNLRMLLRYATAKRSYSILLISLAFLCAALPCLAGPVFAPGTKLFVIKTKRFDIIFSERSRPSAQRLSSFADSVYDEVAGKLEIKASAARIPVVITPDIGNLNGYTERFPYMHIVLYDSSLDLGWTSFEDNFRGLFLHELSHALSLGIRAPWADFLSGIFGSWVLPNLLNTPSFMLEGVTVSFESADGVTGRANDPLVRERVRQDIRENRFKSPIEASGLYDEYPYSDIFYEYGGLFSAYIQKAYGMEKYAELWKGMGALILPVSLDPYEVGFYKAFRKTYGMAFLAAWADFRNSLDLPGLVDPPEIIGPEKLAWLYGGMAGNEDFLFWVDLRSGRAMATELATKKSRALFDAFADSISDASPDAGAGSGTLLVHRSIVLPDGRDRTETIAYDLAARRFDPTTTVADMREARFFRGGWIGIVSRLHSTDLVLARGGELKTLLGGTEELTFASPVVIDEKRVALIVALRGRRNLGILDVDSGELSLLRPQGEGAELFAYARQLSAAGGKVYFNYDSDDRFYKLGVINFETSELRLGTTDYSGGIFWPREAGGRIYYVGRFSEGDKICAYPGSAAALGERSLHFSLERFEPEGPDAGYGASAISEASIEAYRPLAYANPLNMWFLYPDLERLARSFRVFGLFVFQDPIDTNSVNLYLGYDAGYPFADASLIWTTREFPATITASLGDKLVYGAAGAPERQSSASLSATLRLPSYPSLRAAIFGLGGSFSGRGRGESGSPYAWGYSGWNATASANLGWDGITRGASESSARGLSMMSYHDLDIATLAYKTEARFSATIESPPLRLDLWGAWATSPLLTLESTSPAFVADRRPAYFEYATTRTGSSAALAEGSLSLRLADNPSTPTSSACISTASSSTSAAAAPISGRNSSPPPSPASPSTSAPRRGWLRRARASSGRASRAWAKRIPSEFSACASASI
jgi:hypothetical protein